VKFVVETEVGVSKGALQRDQDLLQDLLLLQCSEVLDFEGV
jgi:hypothetical protein